MSRPELDKAAMTKHSPGFDQHDTRIAGTRPANDAGTPAISDVILTERETASLARLSPRTLQRLAEGGDGPRRIRLTQRRIGYLRSDVIRWLESRRSANERAKK